MLYTWAAMLAGELSKGMSGKVATIGGCREYTGAPFFAAMTCLRVSPIHHMPNEQLSFSRKEKKRLHLSALIY